MVSSGQRKFKLHRIDDASAFELMSEVQEFLEISDPITLLAAHGHRINVEAEIAQHIEIGQFIVQDFYLHGRSGRIGGQTQISLKFSRIAPDSTDVTDPFFNWVTFSVGENSAVWQTNGADLFKCIAIITRRDLPVVPRESSDSDTLRALIASQNAAHERMLDQLNRSIIRLNDESKKIQAEAESAEETRRRKFDEGKAELEDQRSKLELQSHMSARRKIATAINEVMTGSDQLASYQSLNNRFATLVFIAFFCLGCAGAYSGYLSTISFGEVVASQMNTTEKMMEVMKVAVADSSTKEDVLLGANLSLARANAASPDDAELEPQDTKTGDDLSSTPKENEPPPMALQPIFPNPLVSVLSESALRGAFTFNMTPDLWFILVKFIGSAIATVYGFVAAASWIRKHLDKIEEITQERLAFVADIQRASWVVEAIHEVQHEAKAELPKEWVDAVTRNLFAPRVSSADLDEGANALRALIGLAGSAKVGPQGLEMEFNKRGTKALGQSGE